MAGATWDMVTEGDSAGTLVRPLAYTTTDADAIRVKAWCVLATPLGTWTMDRRHGLDIERILDPTASDAERAAIVKDLVLTVEGVVEVIEDPTVEVDEDDNTLVTISVTFSVATGEQFTIGVEL